MHDSEREPRYELEDEEVEYVYDPDEYEDEGADEGYDHEEVDPEWGTALIQGLHDLDSRLGRSLTQKELDGITVRAEGQEVPDVNQAYKAYRDAGGFAPDLDSSRGRAEYMRERLLEQQREEADE